MVRLSSAISSPSSPSRREQREYPIAGRSSRIKYCWEVFPDGRTSFINDFFKDQINARQMLILFSNGAIYKGDVQDGQITGRGLLVLRGGDFYEGEFQNSEMHGEGIFSYSSVNSFYRGEFKNNLPSGQGVMAHSDGTLSEGEFVNGFPKSPSSRSPEVEESRPMKRARRE